jgi:hypothetical protein
MQHFSDTEYRHRSIARVSSLHFWMVVVCL